MFTHQDAFNKVWERAKNKVRSVSQLGNPQYRPVGKPPCFAGVLIDDKHYDLLLEGHRADNLSVYKAIVASGYPSDVDYANLQYIHDMNQPSEWNRLLIQYAVEHKLSVPTA